MRFLLVLSAFVLAGCASTQPAAKDGKATATVETQPEKAPEGTHPIAEKGGPPMEPFSLKRSEGGMYRSSVDGGKVVMISFWATWCGPCKTELERMDPVYRDLKDRGFEYLAVSTDTAETVAEVRSYIRSSGYAYPVLLDTTGAMLAQHNPRGDLPFYILVNRKGQIVEKHQGFKPGDEIGLRAKVEALLEAN